MKYHKLYRYAETRQPDKHQEKEACRYLEQVQKNVENRLPESRMSSLGRRFFTTACFYAFKFFWAVDSISLIRFSWFTSLAPGS